MIISSIFYNWLNSDALATYFVEKIQAVRWEILAAKNQKTHKQTNKNQLTGACSHTHLPILSFFPLFKREGVSLYLSEADPLSLCPPLFPFSSMSSPFLSAGSLS